eukprot:6074677-Pleurochrysis_carterae.AAC.1
MFIVASLHYPSGGISIFGRTMAYKWGHPVATLPRIYPLGQGCAHERRPTRAVALCSVWVRAPRRGPAKA